MSPLAGIPGARVRSLWRRVVGAYLIAAVLGVGAAVGGALAAGWILGRTPLWTRPSPLPLLIWGLALGALAIWVWRVAVRLLRWDRRAAAAEIERRLEWSRGSLEGAVEMASDRPGVSTALVTLQRERLGRQLAGRRAGLGHRVARRARAFALGGLVAVALTWALVGAGWRGDPASAGVAWAELAHPVRHLSAPPLPPVTLTAESDRVRRGDDLPVSVGAPGRDSVRLVWRRRGEIARDRWVPLTVGRADAVVPRVEAPTRYWAVAPDGGLSDTLSVEPIDPLLLLDVEIRLDYPDHTGRSAELFSMPVPDLVVPEGTRATLTGRTTLPIETARLQGADGPIPLATTGPRAFRGRFRIVPGAFGWRVRGRAGESLEAVPDSLRFAVVPDSVPRVRIVHPGVDTVLSTDMVQPIVADVRDDYGLSRVELVSWRVSAWGDRGVEQVRSLPVGQRDRRATPRATLDARGRGFLPGDTLRYYVRAFDNAPRPQEARSREYTLRLPTLDEVRERTVASARELVESAESLAEGARAQEESARSLERSSETTPPPGAVGATEPRGQAGVEFRDTEAARRSLEKADNLLRQARDIQESLRELQEAVERAGLTDSSVVERLEEIESLYRRILTPELEEKIQALRESLSELDPERIREAIRQLAKGSVDFRERVEQSVELLRRAALETEFQSLEAQARELAEAQERLSRQTGGDAEAPSDSAGAQAEPGASADERSRPDSTAAEPGDPGEAGSDSTAAPDGGRERGASPTRDPESIERRARDLSERADELADAIRQLSEELGRANEQDARSQADQAGRSSRQAARSDERVARSAARDRSEATRAAHDAERRMREAASALREGREGMQGEWRREVVESLQRAQAEALELSRRQGALNEGLERAVTPDAKSELRSEEVALKRGIEQLAERLSDSSRRSLLVDPGLTGLARDVGSILEQLLSELGDGTRRGRANPELGEQVREGLNELAYQLMRAGQAAASAQGGTGLQEALQRLSQLAEQQGQLNSRSGALSPEGMTRAMMDQLRRLGAGQREIGRRLDELDSSLGPRGQVLGRLDEMAQEAEEIAREMESGRLDRELIERQDRLFQRLLDAGRTLERDEFEKERRAERPTDAQVVQPDDLPADLLDGPEFPHPGADALRRYPPALRRLILEYFDLLNGMEGRR